MVPGSPGTLLTTVGATEAEARLSVVSPPERVDFATATRIAVSVNTVLVATDSPPPLSLVSCRLTLMERMFDSNAWMPVDPSRHEFAWASNGPSRRPRSPVTMPPAS